MKYLILALLSIVFTGSGNFAQAQLSTPSKKPVHWAFSIRKLDNNDYRFEAKATMDNGFHIWAQDPGGDGSLIPTSFTTEQLQGAGWQGDWQESKLPKAEKLEFIDGAIRWHEKEVTFYRDFKANRGDKVKGAVQYQSCNDQMCYPPAIENFIVPVN